jgi:hypothetical protein
MFKADHRQLSLRTLAAARLRTLNLPLCRVTDTFLDNGAQAPSPAKFWLTTTIKLLSIFSVNVDHNGVEQAFMPAVLCHKFLGFSP